MKDTERKITIHVKEIKQDKKTFYVSSAQIGEKWYKIKFTQECEKVPKHRGKYELTIDFDFCSFEKGSIFTNKKGKDVPENDTIWVRKIVDIREYSEEELRAENRERMSAIFG